MRKFQESIREQVEFPRVLEFQLTRAGFPLGQGSQGKSANLLEDQGKSGKLETLDIHKSNRCFWLGEINFRSKLYFRASDLFVWKLSFKQRRRSKVMGTFRIFGGWVAGTFSDRSKSQIPCDMAVIDTILRVSVEKVWLFNVAPLDGSFSSWPGKKTSCNKLCFLFAKAFFSNLNNY